MGERIVKFDDLDREETPYVETHRFTIDGGEEFELDLKPNTFGAIEGLLVKRNPELLRAVFAPNTTARRSKAEVDHIRAWAREQRNEDGTPMFDVRDTGRLPRIIETAWNMAHPEPESVEGEAESGTAEETPEVTAESAESKPDERVAAPSRRRK